MAGDRERILDAYLIVSARLGDREAIGALVQRWNNKLLVHAWRLLRDREAARDAVQDGWAEIVRSLSRLRDEHAFPAWAYRIVSRRCARQIGRLRKERQLAEALTPAEAGFSEPLPQGGAALGNAIASLPPGQQAAIALFYLQDLSVAEVAVALDVPAGTVKTRLMHARRKLRAALEGDE